MACLVGITAWTGRPLAPHQVRIRMADWILPFSVYYQAKVYDALDAKDLARAGACTWSSSSGTKAARRGDCRFGLDPAPARAGRHACRVRRDPPGVRTGGTRAGAARPRRCHPSPSLVPEFRRVGGRQSTVDGQSGVANRHSVASRCSEPTGFRLEPRAESRKSIRSQRRIGSTRSAPASARGCRGGHQQRQRRPRRRSWAVGRLHAGEQRLHVRPAAYASATPGTTPARSPARAPRAAPSTDVAALRAERHAHADLLRALRDGEREQAVDADRREHERNHGEGAEHANLHGAATPSRGRRSRSSVCTFDDRLLGIGPPDDRAQRRRQRPASAAPCAPPDPSAR